MPFSQTQSTIKIGISSCLLGEPVRFDGGHKRDRYIMAVLQDYFQFVPVCPEVAIGMSIPRPPIRIIGSHDNPRVVGVRDESLDVTQQLQDYGQLKAHELCDPIQGISAYIFKGGSPSCGMERVKRYGEPNQPPQKDAVGMYAKMIMQHNPLLPCEEEGRLRDPVLRENFIERVFIYQQWQQLLAQPTASKLMAFHAKHKYAIMAHCQNGLRDLGRLVANNGSAKTQGGLPLDEILKSYGELLMTTLKKPATRQNHTNVLQHIQGYLKTQLDSDDKQELSKAIDDYNAGLLPLLVPMTLLKHHFGKHKNDYIDQQSYLDPHPYELMLRNQL